MGMPPTSIIRTTYHHHVRQQNQIHDDLVHNWAHFICAHWLRILLKYKLWYMQFKQPGGIWGGGSPTLQPRSRPRSDDNLAHHEHDGGFHGDYEV